jgi:hypothetical protein
VFFLIRRRLPVGLGWAGKERQLVGMSLHDFLWDPAFKNVNCL